VRIRIEAGDHCARGGRAHALGAAAAVVALVAAHERHQEAEHGGLDEAGDHVLGFQEAEGAGDVVGAVEVELEDRDEVAAQHADHVATSTRGQHQHAATSAGKTR
jgi:hypothetical protein